MESVVVVAAAIGHLCSGLAIGRMQTQDCNDKANLIKCEPA